MSIRRRALIAVALAVINVLGSLAAAITWGNAFVVPGVLVALVAGGYLLSLRCPNCGARMCKRKVRVLGEEFTYWGGLIPKTCSECGAPLGSTHSGSSSRPGSRG
jgi:hypothetical protein